MTHSELQFSYFLQMIYSIQSEGILVILDCAGNKNLTTRSVFGPAKEAGAGNQAQMCIRWIPKFTVPLKALSTPYLQAKSSLFMLTLVCLHMFLLSYSGINNSKKDFPHQSSIASL